VRLTQSFAQVRRSGPRSGLAQIRARLLDLLRDEEAAGSSGHPDSRFQVDGSTAREVAGPLIVWPSFGQRSRRRADPVSDCLILGAKQAFTREVADG